MRDPIRRLVVAAALSLAPVAVAAQEGVPPTERITLEEALDRANQANLELRVARAEVDAAEARIRSAGAFSNPLASASREQLSGDGDGYDETSITFTQPLEVFGQRGARREAAQRMAEAARARLRNERLRVGFEVHRAYARYAAAEADLAVLTEATDVFRRVQQSGSTRFAEGDISRFDFNRLQIERARYETLLAAQTLALEEAGRELTLLVAPEALETGASLAPRLSLSEMPEGSDLPALTDALIEATTRADVAAAEARVEARRAELALTRRERIPTPTLTGGFKQQADGYQGAVLGVSIPVPIWNRNAGAIAAADAELTAAIAQRELVLARARADIRRSWDTYRSLADRVAVLGESLLPESAGLLETARFAYAEGEMSLLELLDAAEAYREARSSVNSLLSDYLIAGYDLDRATGRLVGFAAPNTPESR